MRANVELLGALPDMQIIAITSYFNLGQNPRRRQNYKFFRKHINVPLLTIEWSPNADYELGSQDADVLLQIGGGDVLWQKEHLLNIAIEHARRMGVKHAAFIDCDIVFENPNWFVPVIQALTQRDFVQCYDCIHYLPAIDRLPIDRKKLAAVVPEAVLEPLLKKLLQESCFYKNVSDNHSGDSFTSLAGNPGMAVAVNLQRYPDFKFYDRNLVGGGDALLLAAMSEYLDVYFEKQGFAPKHRTHAQQWAAKNRIGAMRMGFVPNRLFHLWHGTLESRQYFKRHKILDRHDYDPSVDVIGDSNQALRISSQKDGMKADIYRYFSSRGDA